MTSVEVGGKEAKLVKYNLVVVAYFLIAMTGPYLMLRKFIHYIPSEWQSTLTVTLLVLYGFQALFMIAIVPLGMVFIFSWLYLIDIKAKVRSLYPIVVTSLTPFLILLILAAIHAALFLKINIEPTKDLQKLTELILADVNRQLSPQRPLFLTLGIIAALASITICAHQLHKNLNLKGVLANPLQTWPGWLQKLHQRYNLSVIISTLIPLTFAVSMIAFQKLSGLFADDLFEKLKALPHP